MRMRFWPRSILWQMLAGLVLLEALSIVLFIGLLVSRLSSELQDRTLRRLADQARSLALQAGEAIKENQPGWVGLTVKTEGNSPNVTLAKMTDPKGNVLFVSKGNSELVKLDPSELAEIPLLKENRVKVFPYKKGGWRVRLRFTRTGTCAGLSGWRTIPRALMKFSLL